MVIILFFLSVGAIGFKKIPENFQKENHGRNQMKKQIEYFNWLGYCSIFKHGLFFKS